MKPLLSILIPTKDRYNTLIPVLQGLIRDFDSLDVELIIQDNTYNNEKLQQTLNELNHDQVKYFHISDPMSVTENCDYAVKNAKGEYLIMIGDDDYVLPTIIESVMWMKKNKVECLNSNTATYYWPDISFKHQTGISKSASLVINTPLKKNYKPLDAISELKKVIKSGGTDFANLPRLYHGIVKRIVLERIYDNCQTYFPGPSPDMANSSALSIFTKKFCLYNFPFSVSGKSVLSTSGMGVKHTHVGDLNDKPFLDKRLLIQWDPRIPYFWTGDTIYAQSLSHSLRVCNFQANLNYTKLYAHLLVFESKSILGNREVLLNSVKSNPIIIFTILYWYFIFSKNRALNYFMRKFYPGKNYRAFNEVDQIEKSYKIIASLAC